MEPVLKYIKPFVKNDTNYDQKSNKTSSKYDEN